MRLRECWQCTDTWHMIAVRCCPRLCCASAAGSSTELSTACKGRRPNVVVAAEASKLAGGRPAGAAQGVHLAAQLSYGAAIRPLSCWLA